MNEPAQPLLPVPEFGEEIMKYMCLAYMDETKWNHIPETEKNPLIDACLAYDDELRAKRHFLSGEALESPSATATLRRTSGRVSVTDGPFIETKEQLGGYYEFECKDLDEAITWAAQIPHAATGSIELRPILEM